MDKSVESQFTSEFWRTINEQYFMIDGPVKLPSMNQQKTRNPRFESHHSQLIDNVIRSTKGQQSRTQLMDNLNLRLRLEILLSERVQQQGEVENLVDEMIDTICFEHIISKMDTSQTLLKNINRLPTEKQLEIYNQEAIKLQHLHQEIACPLDSVIMELEDDLNSLQQSKRQELQRLQGYIVEIQKNSLYEYSIQKIGEYSMRIQRNKILHHEQEIDWLLKLIIYHEDFQLAEGMGMAIFNSLGTNHINLDNTIKVYFDRYIHPTPVNMSLAKFKQLQKLREDPIELLPFSDDSIECEMCHLCKQMIDITHLKQCSYNHITMNLHEYNEDLLIPQRYRISKKDQRKFFQDLYSANYIIENNQIKCKRYFCYKCLKFEFNQPDFNAPQWTCPLCQVNDDFIQGLCTCIRCLRNDNIYKLKRTYLEIGGDLDHLFEKSYFEILVNDKRKLIENIPLEFMNNSNSRSENEETLPSKCTKSIKKSTNKIKKIKQNSDTQKVGILRKLQHIENSSSSVFIQ